MIERFSLNPRAGLLRQIVDQNLSEQGGLYNRSECTGGIDPALPKISKKVHKDLGSGGCSLAFELTGRQGFQDIPL